MLDLPRERPPNSARPGPVGFVGKQPNDAATHSREYVAVPPAAAEGGSKSKYAVHAGRC
jgi:hypothetical protein